MARNVFTGQFARAEQLRASTQGANARGVCLHKPDKPRTSTKGHRKIADPTANEAIARADAKIGNRPVDIRIQRNLRFRPEQIDPAGAEEERIMNANRKAAEESARLKEQAAKRKAEKIKGKKLDSFAALAAAVGTEAIAAEAVNHEANTMAGSWSK
jgi:hypothetical protein